MIKAILTTLVMITLGSSISLAQSNSLLVSSTTSQDINQSNSISDTENVTEYSDVNTSKRYIIPESVSHFQMNATTNELSIKVNNEIKYTKAEFLSKDSNTTLQTFHVDDSKESIDLSTVSPGTYYMILSNNNGDVLSEKIIIL